MMKVSVCVPTYNHEKYIAQMIEGALMQQTTFEFEIVIGDDASTDGNATIIKKYAEANPHKIRAFLHAQNLGPKQPKEFAGRNNVLHLLKACKGEYVALCEGDDYWTDPFKLQRQVDFMDAHTGYYICHHNMEVMYEDGSLPHLFNPENQSLVSDISNILEDNWFIATASLLYRNHFREHDFAEWHSTAAAGDWALTIQLAALGKIGYIPQTMGVYRKHSAGLSNIHAHTNIDFLENRKAMFHNVNKWLNYKYNHIISKTIAEYDAKLSLSQ